MKVYIWGVGCAAAELSGELGAGTEIAGFIDSDPERESFMGMKVLRPEELRLERDELVLVSCRDSAGVAESCRRLGIPQDRVVFTKNNLRLEDMNSYSESVRSALSEELLHRLRRGAAAVRVPDDLPRGALEERDLENDRIRVMALQSAVAELDGVPGSAAELGVYRGAFARCINALMPARRLYLFDSFKGFDPAEAAAELDKGGCGESFLRAHEQTSVESVMRIMPHPGSVEIRPGYFPASLGSLEDSFAFVSLDADFEDSTYAGLEYFVPRMSAGGFIFMHDFNSPLRGVRRALERYRADSGLALRGVPLCDIGGTLVLPF